MPINLSQVQQFSKLELTAKQIVEGFITGMHKSPFHGFSVEFAEHRIYNTGESTKNIDWKLFAKTDKLYTKKFEEETNLRCQILIDTSSSMALPKSDNKNVKELNKVGFSVYAAAALLFLMQKQRDAVGLKLFNEEITFNSALKNSNNHVKWLISQLEKELENPKKRTGTRLVEALENTAQQAHKRSLTILFSDFLNQGNDEKDLISSIQRLKHKQHEVIVFHVMDPELELNFEFPNRPTKFVDAETKENIKLNPEEIKTVFIQEKRKKLQELQAEMRNHKVDYLACDIHQGFNNILLAYLAQRKNF